MLLFAVSLEWVRSRHQVDMLGLFPPDGYLNGLACERGGIVFMSSEIPFGNGMGLTARAMSISPDLFEEWHAALFDPTRTRWHLAGFEASEGVVSLTSALNPRYRAVVVPYWFLALALALLPVRMPRSLIIRGRWWWTGRCLSCGYDIRASNNRCPECGAAIRRPGEAAIPTRPSGLHITIRTRTLVWLNVIAGSALVLVLIFQSSRRSILHRSGKIDQAAGLDRRIANIDLDGIPLNLAIARLAQASGARLVMSQNIATRPPPPQMGSNSAYGLRWSAKVHASLHDVSLRHALDILMQEAADQFTAPLTYGAREDGSVLIGADDEMELFVRIYDVGDLLKLLHTHRVRQKDPEWEQLLRDDAPRQTMWHFLDALGISNDNSTWWDLQDEDWNWRLIVIHNATWQSRVERLVAELHAIAHDPSTSRRDRLGGSP